MHRLNSDTILSPMWELKSTTSGSLDVIAVRLSCRERCLFERLDFLDVGGGTLPTVCSDLGLLLHPS